jgi:hypothetical protein
VQAVIDTMGDAYPELRQRAQHLVQTTRAEEERFLATIDGGMTRFDELAPLRSTQGSSALRGEIDGEDAFRLYDTYGFPIDLTELMARERGYRVDIVGFEAALERQRTQSQEERKSRNLGVAADALGDLAAWERAPSDRDVARAGRFVGYDTGHHRLGRRRGATVGRRTRGGHAQRDAVLRRERRTGVRPGRDHRAGLARRRGRGAQGRRKSRRGRHAARRAALRTRQRARADRAPT